MNQPSYTPRLPLGQFVSCGLEPERLERLKGSFEVFTVGYSKEIILDLSAVQDESVPELEEILGFDREKIPAGIVLFYPEAPPELKVYAVVYRDSDQAIDEAPMMFRCWAEDTEHAEEQCLDTHPGGSILWVLTDLESLSEKDMTAFALQSYYAAGPATPAEIEAAAYWAEHDLGRDTFHDHVTSHGFGAPTALGYMTGFGLMRDGADYADAAHSIIVRGLTVDLATEESDAA